SRKWRLDFLSAGGRGACGRGDAAAAVSYCGRYYRSSKRSIVVSHLFGRYWSSAIGLDNCKSSSASQRSYSNGNLADATFVVKPCRRPHCHVSTVSKRS